MQVSYQVLIFVELKSSFVVLIFLSLIFNMLQISAFEIVFPEFREQLERLEKSIAQVPALVIQEVFKGHLQKSRSKLEGVAGDFSSRLSQWDRKRVRLC